MNNNVVLGCILRTINQGLVCFLVLFSCVCFAQSSDLVRANHLIGQVDRGLSRIKTNDVNTINSYTEKLNQAKQILESETDKQDPSFRDAAGQWMKVRDRLYATLEQWKQVNTTAEKPKTPSKSSSSQLYNQLISKYQSQNRPRLPAELDSHTGKQWLSAMLALYGHAWQQDNNLASQWHANGQLSSKDYERFKRWVNGTWHQQIGDQINQAYSNWNNALNGNLNESQKFFGINDDDKNKIMNIAGSNHLKGNQALLARSNQLLELLVETEKALGKPQTQLRQKQKDILSTASQRLQELTPLAQKYQGEWAKLPKKSRTNPNSQYLWLNGNRFAEITQKGEVWINSNFVGSIGTNGEIYQKGNYVGKIAENNELWMSRKNISAKFMDNGEVWVGGSHVGTIHKDGNVTGTGTAASVEGPGDWRHAAVVFFLQVFPTR